MALSSGSNSDPNIGTTTLGSAAALNGDALVATDTRGYVSASVQIEGPFVGTLSFQGSNNSTTWVAVQGTNLSAQAAPPVFTTTVPGLFHVPLNFRFLRVRLTAYTSGTATITCVLYALSATDLKARNSTIYGTYSSTQVSVSVDADGKIAVTSTLVSSIPAAQITSQNSINPATARYTSYTATQKIALKQFYAAGTGIGKQVIYRSSPMAISLAPSGGFNTIGEVANWPYSTSGSSGTLVTLDTTNKIEGAGSVLITFTQSDSGRDHVLTYTYPSPVDVSSWRYITAWFYHAGPSGGSFTRTAQIIFTDGNGSTRVYEISGKTDIAPWSTAQWFQIVGDIENPTSVGGSAFDPTGVVSIKLRMFDSNNRASNCRWDQVRFEGMLTAIFPIYHPANVSFNISLDPVVVLEIGDQILISQKNNDSVRKEFFAQASGVSIV